MSEKEFKVYNLSDVIHDGTQLAQANMFYVGDWAYVKKIGKKGLVKETHSGECEQLVTLLMENGTTLKVRSDECDFTTPDPKTAFLSELSELLRKYNAVIDASWDEYFDNGYPKIDLDISFNGHVYGICFENVLDNSLTADNVLKYDK